MKKHFSTSRGCSRAPMAVGAVSAMLFAAGCSDATDDLATGDPKDSPHGAMIESRSRVAESAEFARMENYVAARVRAADVVRSFQLPSGDAVDCVEREKQPSLKDGPTRGRPLATPPPVAPSMVPVARPEAICPVGTVPIKRVTAADMARFKTLEDRMRKYPSHRGADDATARMASAAAPSANGPTDFHQYAHAYQFVANVGAHVRINTLVPEVESNAEFSLGQTWVVRGTGNGLQTLEAGVQKYVDLYNNSNLHLFIYSTSDNYASTGCYNLDCPRFVQMDNTVVIGGDLASSTYGGAQIDYELKWLLSDGNWWLGVGDTWVGYYPGTLFNEAGLKNGADQIDFGGEILDDRRQHSAHTSTDMGSGAFPSAGWQHAAYQRDIYYFTSATTATAAALTPARNNANCYDISLFINGVEGWGSYFFYGGSGYNSNCQ